MFHLSERDKEKCRAATCGAEIAKVKLAPSGKVIPVNFAPDPAGTVGLTGRGPVHMEAVVLGRASRERWTGGPLYMSHFATCPASAAFRTRTR